MAKFVSLLTGSIMSKASCALFDFGFRVGNAELISFSRIFACSNGTRSSLFTVISRDALKCDISVQG